MLGPVDYAIWFVNFFLQLFCIYVIVKTGSLRRYFTLAFFMFACLAMSVGDYIIIHTSGFSSGANWYFYHYTGSVLIICLYFVLMNLYMQAFSDLGVDRVIRIFALLLLGGTCGVSYYMVTISSDKMVTHFVFELGQNLFFVAVVLTYLLWGAMVKLKENRARLVQLVLSLGVYVSLSAGSYALLSMHSGHIFWRYFMSSIDLWLPLSWAFTFLRVPEDRLIVTARVVTPRA